MRSVAMIGVCLVVTAHAQGQGCGRWETLGDEDGKLRGEVLALALWDPDGPGGQEPWIVAGGAFGAVGGRGIAYWNGTQWVALGGGVSSSGGFSQHAVKALAVMSNGDLVAGGDFWQMANRPGTYSIARWDGEAWHAMGEGLSGDYEFDTVLSLQALPNGHLLAGARVTEMGRDFFRWDGSNWWALSSDRHLYSLALLENGEILTGGTNVARLTETGWQPYLPFTHTPPWASCFAPLTGGTFIVGGTFSRSGATVLGNIARWTGSAWAPIGSGLTEGPSPGVLACLALPGGDLIAGGTFTMENGSSGGIAYWDASESRWLALGTGYVATVHALLRLPNGDIVVNGDSLWNVCHADFDCDGFASGVDFDLYVSAFESGDLRADFDHDGFVSGIDYDLYVLSFEEGC